MFSTLITIKNISWAANLHNRSIFIPEGTCNNEDWNNDADHSALHHRNKRAWSKVFPYYWFYCFFYEINAALVKLLSAMGSKYYMNKKGNCDLLTQNSEIRIVRFKHNSEKKKTELQEKQVGEFEVISFIYLFMFIFIFMWCEKKFVNSKFWDRNFNVFPFEFISHSFEITSYNKKNPSELLPSEILWL